MNTPLQILASMSEVVELCLEGGDEVDGLCFGRWFGEHFGLAGRLPDVGSGVGVGGAHADEDRAAGDGFADCGFGGVEAIADFRAAAVNDWCAFGW
jgi:hypothetical protein